jgi:hypothetical protein
MRQILVITGALLLGACSVEPGSEKWCEQKKEQAKSEWTSSDAITFASSCLLDSTTIGSKEWCDDLSDKPKGEWTANEAADYTRYCLMP